MNSGFGILFGLPRMRGDRPQEAKVSKVSKKATPHARGSTLPPFVFVRRREGYPACAGIDPGTNQIREDR